MTCSRYSEQLSDYFAGNLAEPARSEIAAHLTGCADCTAQLREIETILALLQTRKAPAAPADLAARLHVRLADEPMPAKPSVALAWRSMLTGAVAASLIMFGTWAFLRTQAPLPTIQTAAVTVATPVAVNIGFDVREDVENVTYTIDLPHGLQFVDADNQPLEAQSITWQGSLKRGKTVVPITVRGIQPGRYEILATVRKNQFAQTTKIVLPVHGKQGVRPGGSAANG